MHYTEFSPHKDLRPYIDCYWQVAGDNIIEQQERILPDGRVDIIINLGDDYRFYLDHFTNHQGLSLQDIVRECGYYGHSHLTHATKKYTGLLPSRLIR